MPYGVKTGWRRETLPKPEILSYPQTSAVIDSAVLNATGVVPDASGPYVGRRYMLQGTILSKRNDNQYERYVAGAGQNIAGILYDTTEFADGSNQSDEPAAFVRRNIEFKATAIVDYATYEVALKAALSTCEFV